MEERFWSKVHKRGTSECWNWQASLNSDGYGHMYEKDRLHKAHRISWQLHYGPIITQQQVLHSCDNRKCVNPSHLKLGHHKQNMRDMTLRGRLVRGAKLDQKLAEARRAERERCAQAVCNYVGKCNSNKCPCWIIRALEDV